MRKDDLVLFHGHNQVYAYGYVTAKVYWPDNDFIWPNGDVGTTSTPSGMSTVIPEDTRPASADLRSVLPRFVARGVQYHDLDGRRVDDVLAPVFSDGYLPGATKFTLPPTGQPQRPSPPTDGQPSAEGVPADGDIGTGFVELDFTAITATQDVITPNWKAVERGTLGHKQTLTSAWVPRTVTATGRPSVTVRLRTRSSTASPGRNPHSPWVSTNASYRGSICAQARAMAMTSAGLMTRSGSTWSWSRSTGASTASNGS
jgi:hypothetical protein